MQRQVSTDKGIEEAGSKAQYAKRYVSFLKGLKASEAEHHGIASRFKETIERQKIIDKESARVIASRAPQHLAASVDRFDTAWAGIAAVRPPSC